MFLRDKKFLYTTYRGIRFILPQFFRKSDEEPMLLQGEKGVFVQIVDASAQKAIAVTPSDTAILTNGATKGLYIGNGGTLVVTMADGSDATFTSLAIGVIHPISVTKIKASGTTAANILVVY